MAPSIPQEKLPNPPPGFVFFMPNFIGIGLAYTVETFRVESMLAKALPLGSHPYALMGLGAFALFNTNSYLAMSVVLGRTEHGVKVPNLYAKKEECKTAVVFNTIQRGHQNFLEQLPQLALSLFVMNSVIRRPNVSGMMLLLFSAGRIGYALGYKSSDVQNRVKGLLFATFMHSIGVGYCALAGMTLFGVNLIDFE